MKENVIFYFSGTGNSYQVARDLSSKLTDCEVVNMADYSNKIINGAERVGIIFPTYFWGIPNIVKRFLGEVRLDKETYVYAVTTCGGTPGAAFYQINDLLKSQEKRLDAGFYILMPENYIVLYNADSAKKQELLFNKEQDKIKIITEVVRKREQRKFEQTKYLLDRLLGKRVNSFVVGKFPAKDNGFVIGDTCNGCGRCKRACSMDNIEIVCGKPEWQHHCEFCMGCLQSCPKKAIDWKNRTQRRKRYLNPNINEIHLES